jgi:hypothetical protein
LRLKSVRFLREAHLSHLGHFNLGTIQRQILPMRWRPNLVFKARQNLVAVEALCNFARDISVRCAHIPTSPPLQHAVKAGNESSIAVPRRGACVSGVKKAFG